MDATNDWFWSTGETVASVVAGTVAIYITMLVGVRIAGRRTISQLSAFDAIVTIALGSTLATTAASSDPSRVEGAAVIVTLLVLQVVIAFLRQRSAVVRRLVDFSPEVIVRDGRVALPRSPLSTQLSGEEPRSKLRQKGEFDVDALRIVILEADGGISAG
jgi:uncharacterized membrane protein YcaP (DUF421 family)